MTSRFIPSALLIVLILGFLFVNGCGSKEKEVFDIPTGVNLVENPSFEEWEGDIPVGWELIHIEGEGQNSVFYGKTSEEKNTGDYSFYIRGAYNTDKWDVLIQRIAIIPNQYITFSAAMMSERLAVNKDQKKRAHVFVRFLDKEGNRLSDLRLYGDMRLPPRYGTTYWSIDRSRERADKDAYFVEIGLVNTMTGHLYFDDVELMIEEQPPWIIKETKYVDYYYFEEKPLPHDAFERETELIERYAERLGIRVGEKIMYYYYPSEEVLKEILGVRRGHQRALWDRKELHTTEPYEEHIVVHLLLSHLGYPPYGLVEGLVIALIGDYQGEDIHLVAKYYLLQMQIPALFKTLKREEVAEESSDIIIPAWGSFCIYLMDKYGMETFMELYKRSAGIYEEGEFNILFKELYDDDFPVIDRAWRLYVLRYQGDAPGDSLP